MEIIEYRDFANDEGKIHHRDLYRGKSCAYIRRPKNSWL
jgi:hypothetical protein